MVEIGLVALVKTLKILLFNYFAFIFHRKGALIWTSLNLLHLIRIYVKFDWKWGEEKCEKFTIQMTDTDNVKSETFGLGKLKMYLN